MKIPTPKDRTRTWLLYAAEGQRGANWLKDANVGSYVFWRHGSDAHTKTMRPGDSALIYLAGDTVDSSEIVALGIIAAVRRPFILDNDQRVQRIPFLLLNDLRVKPLPWSQVRRSIDVAPTKTSGAVHPVDPIVAAEISALTDFSFPFELNNSLSEINPSTLWSSLLDHKKYFTITPEYQTSPSRKNVDINSLAKVSSFEEFASILTHELDQVINDSSPETKPKTERISNLKTEQDFKKFEIDTEYAPESVTPDFDTSPSNNKFSYGEDIPSDYAKDVPSVAKKRDGGTGSVDGVAPDHSSPTQIPHVPPRTFIGTGLSESYSSSSIFTAGSIADRVMAGDKDHLRVDIEARAFARLIASKGSKPPLSVGIFGRWGSGKTFFMNRIGEELIAISDSKQEGFHQGIVQVEFNAWHYMETNVWASLVDVIFKDLDRKITRTENSNSGSLFDQLSTVQNLRLDAIDNLIKSVLITSEARQAVTAARKDFDEYGPNGAQLWQSIFEAMGITKAESHNKVDLEKAAALLGNDQFTADSKSLRTLATELHSSATEGRMALNALRQQITNPWALGSLAIMLLVIPLGVKILLENITSTPNMLITATSTLAAWGAVIGKHVRSGVTLLNRVNNKISDARTEFMTNHKSKLDEAELKLEGAKQTLQSAEEQVQTALQALSEDSPGARLASFIRQRAESDDYSKHFGVINTIRNDFEQLSELMGASSSGDKQKQLKSFRKDMLQKISALKQAHSNIFTLVDNSPKTDHVDLIVPDSELSTIRDKVAALEQSLLSEVQSKEKPFTRIVLKIDDLDRCPPDKVADVLQAVHLFLNFPLFVILVCVDERWMSTSLKAKFGALVDGTGGATTGDYLEKIFQIPYWTRAMDEEASSDFAGYLVSGVTRTSSKETLPTNIRKLVNDDATSDDGIIIKEQKNDLNAVNIKLDQPFLDLNNVTEPEDSDSSELEKNDTPTSEPKDESRQLGIEPTEKRVPVSYAPLILTSDESAALQKVAAFAGDTPRRTLRFVNVYLLIKSTMEPIEGDLFVDGEGNSFGHQALLVQLALATRADIIAAFYFNALDNFKADIANLNETKSNSLFKASVFLQKYILEKIVLPESNLSALEKFNCEQIIHVLMLICEYANLDALNKSPDDRQLLEDLLRTEHLARRYTFTPNNGTINLDN